MTRPALSVILSYREHVDQAMATLLQQEEHAEEIASLVELGLHHEQQHQELLLTDIKFTLGTNPMHPPYRAEGRYSAGAMNNSKEPVSSISYSNIPGGIYTIGHQGGGFCWDNELSVHRVLLEDFKISDRLVTVGEYLAFMQDGGYERFELWQMEGIEWARNLDIKAPLYWYPDEEGNWLHYRLNGGLMPLDPSLPVTHISWYEADAYARWADARLPTEFEWEVAATQRQPDIPADGNWGGVSGLSPPTGIGTGSSVYGPRLGVDQFQLFTLPSLPATSRSTRRVQRKIYGESDGFAGRLLRDPRQSHPTHLPQLLSNG
jgi:ergothioneine biosynthesis protein EgtB